MKSHVVALSGGVGGAKLAHGLSLLLPPEDLTVIVNTGDDFEHLGLTICPDLDSVVYAFSNLSDPIRGWGRCNETWTFQAALTGLGVDPWFQLGDADLAMHVARTAELKRGKTLSQVTRSLGHALGIRHPIVPMSDHAVRTQLLTDAGWLDFQEYFVHRQCAPKLKALRFAGCEDAVAQPEALRALERSDLRAIIVCPSNPFVSIAPILALPALHAAIAASDAPRLAVTPIIGGKAVKGPAAKMLRELGHPISPSAVAHYYTGLLDAFIYDVSDPPCEGPPGMKMLGAQTLMSNLEQRRQLADFVLTAADSLI